MAQLQQRLARRDERREAHVAELKSTLDLLRVQIRDLDRRVALRRQSALSPKVLRHVMMTRARTLVPDRYSAAAAEQREASFVQASAAYRALLDDETARTAGLQQLTIDGLAWWAPLDERLPERAERTVCQGFPYRVLLQTRELAVGGVMLDLGGNIGRTSVTRGLLGDVRAVYAAEPDPANYAALLQNVLTHGLRGIVLPDQVAIGSVRGEVQLHRSRFMGGHRVVFGEGDRGAQLVTVPCWPLDEWLEHIGCDPRSVGFVKVDVQGSEVELLRGAAGLLARRQAAWQIEIDPDLLKKAGRDVAEILTLFEAHFTHFIDIGTPRPGPRLVAMNELRERIDYVGTEQKKTDLLLFAAQG